MSKVLTSVKVEPDVYNQFKQDTNNLKFNFQDLVNRSMHLFLTDANFKQTLLNHHVPLLSLASQQTQLPSLQQSEK